MEDEQIIALYFERSQAALTETSAKYNGYCNTIAYNILQNIQDSEECVNDMLQTLWERIPPERPICFKAFLGKIIRNLALNKAKYNSAAKRGGGRREEVLEELAECVADKNTVESEIDRKHLSELIDCFLGGLPREKRIIFVRRYWYISSVKEIAADYGISEGTVKSMLFRLRGELKEYLEKEGVAL